MQDLRNKNYRELIDDVIAKEFRSCADLERKAKVANGSIRRVVNGERRLTEFIAHKLSMVTSLNSVHLLKLQVDFYYAEYLAALEQNPKPGKHLQFYGVRSGCREDKKRD